MALLPEPSRFHIFEPGLDIKRDFHIAAPALVAVKFALYHKMLFSFPSYHIHFMLHTISLYYLSRLCIISPGLEQFSHIELKGKACRAKLKKRLLKIVAGDRKSTRLNSSHVAISYA